MGHKVDRNDVVEALQDLRLDTSEIGKNTYTEGKRYGFNQGINEAIQAVVKVSQDSEDSEK